MGYGRDIYGVRNNQVYPKDDRIFPENSYGKRKVKDENDDHYYDDHNDDNYHKAAKEKGRMHPKDVRFYSVRNHNEIEQDKNDEDHIHYDQRRYMKDDDDEDSDNSDDDLDGREQETKSSFKNRKYYETNEDLHNNNDFVHDFENIELYRYGPHNIMADIWSERDSGKEQDDDRNLRDKQVGYDDHHHSFHPCKRRLLWTP